MLIPRKGYGIKHHEIYPAFGRKGLVARQWNFRSYRKVVSDGPEAEAQESIPKTKILRAQRLLFMELTSKLLLTEIHIVKLSVTKR